MPAPPLVEPELGPFELDPPPEARSVPPSYPEWIAAPEVHVRHQSPRCHVFRVREWVRVNCEAKPDNFFDIGSVELVSGPVGGVDLSRNRHGKGGELVFPLRRGDRRVLTVHEVVDRMGWSGLRYGLAFAITEAWLPGAVRPVLTVD